MTTNTTISTTARRPMRALASVRDDLRQRRQAREHYRALSRELASYTSASDVNDLLGLISKETGPEAEQIREILSHNLGSRALAS